MKKKSITGLATLTLALLCMQPAQALSINFNGAFNQDDDVQFFTFTVNPISTVTISTTSFTAGGFVPALHIWDSTGQAASANASETPDAAEAIFNVVSLPVGTYYGAVSQWHNAAPQDYSILYDPSEFSKYGQHTYTETDSGCPSGGTFSYDFGGGCSQRGNAWAFDVTGVSSASLYPTVSAPEPSSLALTLLGLAGVAPVVRRRFRAN